VRRVIRGDLPVVGDDDERRPRRRAIRLEMPVEVPLADGVDAGDRLVEEEKAWPGDEAAGEIDPLPLSPRERPDRPARQVRPSHPAERLLGPAALVAADEAGPPAPDAGEDELDRQRRKAGVGRLQLRDVADRARRRLPWVAPEKGDPAPVGADEPEERPEKGRLAGAVRPDDRQRAPLGQIERDRLDGETVAVADREVFDGDGGVAHGDPP